MNRRTRSALVFFLLLSVLSWGEVSYGKDKDAPPADVRCPVCGMFVAKYAQWLVTALHQSGKKEYFDGVKDMMAYYFDAGQFGGKDDDPLGEIQVKDYYTLEWLDGKKAYYVAGSDVFGPMGHELIPFATKEGADNFFKDHHGKKVLAFKEITREMVQSLRSGQEMR